jgi:signal transduction histidine kinase
MAPTRLLDTVQRLLETPVADLRGALSHAADLVADAVRADKVDAFLYDPARDTLVAVGTSDQPLSHQQRAHGLDVLPIANGGRAVHVFETGETFVTGDLQSDQDELMGVRRALRIQSKIGVPLDVGGARRGILMIASQQRDFFTPDDVRFAQTVAQWISLVAHRAELVEELAQRAVAEGRRAAAEELITVLAHDLRNVLGPMQVRLYVMRRRSTAEARDQDTRELDLVMNGVRRLEALIANILDVARLDQGVLQIDVEPVDIVALLREAAAGLATEDHPVQVEAAEQCVVAADPARVRQCVENLVSNAVQHSPKEAPVRIAVERRPQGGGDWVRIDVTDRGPGVPRELLPHIFDRFVTGSRRRGGLGLGLYLAKRIAVLHGGDLVVSSVPGEGARFTLTLPCAAA